MKSPLAAHVHERRGGGALSTRLIRLSSPAHAVCDAPTEELVLGLMLDGSAGARWSWDGARPYQTRSRRPGTLGLTPIGAAGTFEVDGPSTMLIVALPYKALTARLVADTAIRRDFGNLHDAYSEHRPARNLALRLWRAANGTSFGADDLVDALSERLLVTLSDSSTEFGRDAARRSGLDAVERRQVLARAEADGANVAALALAAGLPVRTFRRRFAESFGIAPHRWLAERRIERARMLLADASLPLSQAALDLGFASQAHFTEAFRAATGLTPRRYRHCVQGR